MADRPDDLHELLALLYKPHPWHGIPIGERAPEVVAAYLEIVPTDTVKYEIEKATGYLRVDRPQRFSSLCPTLYGFVPQTHCGERTAELCRRRTGRPDLAGDGDPLDICVLSEKPFSHGDVLVQAVPIGGLRMLDHGEADDKILAVLEGDVAYGGWRDVADVPEPLVARLRHYFLTYKQPPGTADREVDITHVYDRAEAFEVIRRSGEDYRERFPDLRSRLAAALRRPVGGEGRADRRGGR